MIHTIILTNIFSSLVIHVRDHCHVETILVIRDVGVQVKTVYLGGRSSSRFIDRSKITDIIINEAITMMHIRVYMAIIVEGEDKMVVVFQHLLPRLKVLLQAYHGARFIIFNE
ncbi:hypothetical protein BGZ76_000904 [Entomortierella beljakovae]|nr:hypothetical protein BGZ76_000904 [Entomortierella beljakovae]